MRAKERIVLLLTMAAMGLGCGDDSGKGTKADGSVQEDDAGVDGGNGGAESDASMDAGATEDDAGVDAGDEADSAVEPDGSVEGPGACPTVTTPKRLVSDVENMWSLPRLGGDYVYYSDDSTIKRVPKCGGDSEDVVTADLSISTFDVHADVVYFRDQDGISSAPAQPNSTKSSLIASDATVLDIDVTAEGVFWAEASQQAVRIRRADLDGNNALTLFEEADTGLQQITVHGDHVYWLSGGAVISRVKTAAPSATATKLLELPGGAVSYSEHFAVDANQVYATDDKSHDTTSLWRAPNDGSKPEGIPLAYIFSANTSAVAVSSGTVYFSTRNSSSKIYKIDATADFGTTPTELGASTRVSHLVLDAHDIIIRAGDGPYHLERLSR